MVQDLQQMDRLMEKACDYFDHFHWLYGEQTFPSGVSTLDIMGVLLEDTGRNALANGHPDVALHYLEWAAREEEKTRHEVKASTKELILECKSKI